MLATLMEPDDHYILKKLNNEILPYLVTGRLLTKEWFVYFALVHGYIAAVASALAGVGIGTPLIALVQGEASDKAKAVDTLKEVLPPEWWWLGGIALIIWIGIRVVAKQQNVETRGLLAAECAKSMQIYKNKLYTALSTSDPMQQIGEIQKLIDDRVQRAITDNVWKYDPLPPDEMLLEPMRAELSTIRARFMRDWKPVPAEAQ